MTYVRVRDNETGHHYSVPQEYVDSHKDAVSVLNQPGEHVDGSPVAPKYKTSVDEAASTANGQSADTTKEK